MKRKVGEIFKLHNEWYQCIEGRCKDCYFSEKRFVCKQLITKYFCTSGIIFKKLEKVGEPYTHYCPSGRIIYFQRYKIFNKSYSHNTEYIMCDFNEDGVVSIEIKQTKEDMEDREYSEEEFKNNPRFQHHKNIEQVINMKKMKEFDINLAKQGKPVCTRDGKKARIICFDAKDTQPIIGLYEKNIDGIVREYLCSYHTDGRMYDDQDTGYDLMMLPEKREGWINVYRDCDGANITKDDNIYSSREAAIASAQFIDGNSYVATTKINWEE